MGEGRIRVHRSKEQLLALRMLEGLDYEVFSLKMMLMNEYLPKPLSLTFNKIPISNVLQ